MEKKAKVKTDPRKFYTLFILIMPTILIALMGSIEDYSLKLILQGITFVFQIVVINGILDDFYGK